MRRSYSFLAFTLSAFWAQSMAFASDNVVIPTQYEEDRFYVTPPPFKGVGSKMLLDSGGTTGVYSEFAWYWKDQESKIDKNYLFFGSSSPFKVFPGDTIQKNSIRLIPANDEEAVMVRKLLKDGVFGNGWLGTRKWNFNYPEKKLVLLNSVKFPRGKEISLHFKSKLFYPRISVTVDGEALDVLFDTGATSLFSEKAIQELSLGTAFSASSFIRESIFDAWKKKHSDWKVIEGGDRMGNNPIIRVPSIQVAGYEVGPVWFASRPNEAYDEMMAQFMDCKCAGAIGGNVLKNFDIIIDYPGETAWFYKK